MEVNNALKPVVFDPKYMIPQEIMDDVICRFLLNIPKEEKFDPIRVCFQVELAHWYFTDYHCGEGCSARLAQLRNIPYNQFAYLMFQKTPHLKAQLRGIDQHLAAFREYKMRVPTFGAILMNQKMTKVVLVQGYRSHWGFPKGKVNEVEDPVSCATREVYEETGYDISPLVNPNHYIESKVLERNDRLYIVRGVDPKFDFQPQTQFEIKNIKWFNINELPEFKKDTNAALVKSGISASSFYSVYPYVKRLKIWIADKLEGRNKIHNFNVKPDAGEVQTSGNSSNQRNPTKHQQHTNIPGKVLETFQFPQHFLQSGGGASVTAAGWQLFPQAQTEQKMVVNPNAIALQELLLGQQPNQTRQNSAKNTGSKQKNTRRRLFSEDSTQGSVPAGIIGKPSKKSLPLATTTNQKQKPSFAKDISQSSEVRRQFLTAPAWKNFSFDRERVYKAFFTPPPATSA